MSKLEQLKKVFDNTTLNSKLVHLNEEQATAFVDFMQDESKFLKLVRFVKMSKPTKTIAKLISNGRFLHPWKSGLQLDDSKRAQFAGDTIELVSKMLKGKFMVTDEELSDNVEGLSLTTHLMKILAKKIANELEEISIYGRNVGSNAKTALDMFDGYKFRLLQEGNVLDASNTGVFTTRNITKGKFAKMMKVLATKYRQDVKYFVSSNVAIDYGLLFDTVADSNVRNELRTQILGKSMVEVPLMRVEEPVYATAGATTVANIGAEGATTLDLTSASALAVGDSFAVAKGTKMEKIYRVTAKTTNTVTLDRPLEYEVPATTTVHEVTLDGTDAILTNPLNFIYAIQTGGEGVEFESERIPSVGYQYHFKMRLDVAIENPEASVLIHSLKDNVITD